MFIAIVSIAAQVTFDVIRGQPGFKGQADRYVGATGVPESVAHRFADAPVGKRIVVYPGINVNMYRDNVNALDLLST